ncbi:MAG: histidinol-phosphate transaminase, partial [Ignavibacteriales bacterium]|nr:histidinol-phosphate transaminase [Ignavibacteriales bacterium]
PVTFDGVPLNRYPDPFQCELRKKLSARLDVPADMIFTGVGSDEVIDLLIRLFCEPARDSIAVLEPTYGVYRVAANVNAVEVISIELDENFQLDLVRISKSIKSTTKLVFLCSPNNPTGNLLRREDVFTLCKELHAIVIVDEAYIEFADALGDITNEVERHDNLVVLRTLSKAWGLAGIRLGYCIAHPRVVSYLLRIKAPYNVNAVTSHMALDALEKPEFLASSICLIKRERTRLITALKNLPDVVHVYPSDANFALVEFKDAHAVYERLARKGIIVRRRSEQRLTNCLRVTVGTPSENDLLITTLADRT